MGRRRAHDAGVSGGGGTHPLDGGGWAGLSIPFSAFPWGSQPWVGAEAPRSFLVTLESLKWDVFSMELGSDLATSGLGVRGSGPWGCRLHLCCRFPQCCTCQEEEDPGQRQVPTPRAASPCTPLYTRQSSGKARKPQP